MAMLTALVTPLLVTAAVAAPILLSETYKTRRMVENHQQPDRVTKYPETPSSMTTEPAWQTVGENNMVSQMGKALPPTIDSLVKINKHHIKTSADRAVASLQLRSLIDSNAPEFVQTLAVLK